MRVKDKAALLAELKANMPSEEEIERRAAADPDNPPWTDEQLAAAVRIDPEKKVAVSLRLDPHIIDAYKAEGRGWQTRMNDVLRAGITTEPLEFSMRQVDALEQFSRAVSRSEWAKNGIDLGQEAHASRVAKRLKALLDGKPFAFTKEDLLFLAEASADLIEKSTPLLAHPMVAPSAKRDAQWRMIIGRDMRDLATLIRSRLQRRPQHSAK